MSKVVTPSSLKWLINKRARLLGQIERIEQLSPVLYSNSQLLEAARLKFQKLEKLNKHYLGLEDKLPVLRKQLEAIDIALDLHDIKINKAYIRPIRPSSNLTALKPHGYKLGYGEITRSIFEYLRLKGSSASTGEISLYIIKKNGLDSELSKSLPIFIDKVGSRLNALTFERKISRLHNPNQGKQGVWELPLLDDETIGSL